MHRRITFQGNSAAVANLAEQLIPIEGVIALAHLPDGSLKPRGGVLHVDVLNSHADEVLRRARPALDDESVEVSVVIAQSTAIVDRARAHLVHKDADETLWEEMESDLRNHGRVSWNYVVLMALGGIIAASGFLLEPVSQAIALVGAAIIAPAFEPVAKLAQGIVLRQWTICGRALISIATGYAVLCAAAFVTTTLLSWLDGRAHAKLLAQPVLEPLTTLQPGPLLMSAAAAVAGIVMVVSLRDLYVVGPLMVLVLISNLSLVGAGLALRDLPVALGSLGRLGCDIALIVVLGGGVFAWKQRAFHRRRPLS
jgi:Domain of unknown function (DUF389)